MFVFCPSLPSLLFSAANTINDLAIARQIQEDLDQQSLTEDPSPSGAEGRGPAIGDRSSNNFDTVELEEPHFYGKGYTTGGGTYPMS